MANRRTTRTRKKVHLMTTYLRVALRLAILAIALTQPNQTFAQDPEGRWVRQSLRSSCEWWETCPRRYIWRYVRPRHYEIRNVYREDFDVQCKDFVTAVGEERYGRDRAKESAEQAYMEIVRNKYGVKWMD